MSELVKVDMSQFGLEEKKAAEIRKDFDAVLKIAEELEGDYNEIVAIEEIDSSVCAKAKKLRLKYSKMRTGVEKVRKERKAFYLSGGRAVDGLAHAYKHAVEGNEANLKEIETHFERIEADRIAELQAERAEKLSPYVEDAHERDLAKFADDEFEALFQMKKKEHEDEIAAKKEAAAAEVARLKAEAEENERIRKENARLEAEAKEREEKAKAEQMEREKAESERVAKEAAERAAIEAEREKERKEAQAKIEAAEAERKRVESEAKAKEEAEAKERAEAVAREKNKENKARVHNEIIDGIVVALQADRGLSDSDAKRMAKDIVIAIVKGNVKNVSISY